MDNITKSLIFVLTIGGLIAFMAPSGGGAPAANPAKGKPVSANPPATANAIAAEQPVEESVFGDIEEFDHSQFGEPLHGFGENPDEEKSSEASGKKDKDVGEEDENQTIDFADTTGGWSTVNSGRNDAPRSAPVQSGKAPKMPKSGPAPRWQGKKPPSS